MPDTMTVELASGYLYARFPWDATYDAVQRITVTAVSASATANGCVQPSGLKLIPIATARTGMIAAFNAAVASSVILAGQPDDAPPVFYNNTYIGGNHGAAFAKRITSTAHGKDVSDIGSQWLSGGVTFYIIRVVDANTLWVLSNNTGANAERWGFNTTLAAVSTLTHVAGATHTANIVTSASVTQQIYPAVQDQLRKVFRNGTQELTADGVYDCSFVTVEESYGLANPAAMLDFLIAGRPWAAEPALNDNSITTQVTLSHTYAIQDNGSMSVTGRFENLQTIDLNTNNGYIGFMQASTASWVSAGSVESLSLYIPRITTIVGGVKTWDFQAGEVISGTFEQLSFPLAKWSDTSNPPDRMVEYVKNTATGINQRGYVVGYSRLSGSGAALQNYIIRAGFISAARKMYPSCLTHSAPIFGAPLIILPVNSVVNATAYRIAYNLAAIPEATTAAVRLTDTGAEVILDFHTNVTAKAVPVPTKLNGKTVTIVDGNGNLTLDSAVVTGGEITVTVTGSYGAAVLQVA